MATDRKTPDGGGTAGTEAAVAAQPALLWTTPIVLERAGGGKKKRKKKYSRGTKGWQRLALGLSSAAYRISNGFAGGARRFVKRSKRSEKKKRDGMARDLFANLSRGAGKGLSEASKAPREISKRVSTRRTWRAFRVATPFA